MFGKGFKLFRFSGITVKLDLSWFIIAVLIAWSLATEFLPRYYASGLGTHTYWWMGAAGAIGLLLSIIVHELSHSLVGQHYGMGVRGITLFVFGGVAELEEEPRSAKTEFLMAIAGPISSVVVAGICYGLYYLADTYIAEPYWALVTGGVLWWLAFINVLLAAFNLIPGFPLDGGRVLRAALWAWRGNLRSATRTAATLGAGCGVLLIAMGVLSLLMGSLVGGMWWILIGLFLRNAANASYQQVLVRQSLEGMPVRRFMNPHPVTVPPQTSVADLVENYIYQRHYKMYPVVDDQGRLLGCVTIDQVKSVPREDWPRLSVSDLARSCGSQNTIRPDDDALKALSLMNRTRVSRLMVAENGYLAGILSLRDMLSFLAVKMELEDGHA